MYPGYYVTKLMVPVDGVPTQVTLSVTQRDGGWIAKAEDADGGVRISAKTSSKKEALNYIHDWMSRTWFTWSDGSWAFDGLSDDAFCEQLAREFPRGTLVVLTEDIGVSRSQILRAGTVVSVKKIDCSLMYPKAYLRNEKTKKDFDLFIDESWIPFKKTFGIVRGGKLETIPPPPGDFDPDYRFWVRKTFQPGTRVRLLDEYEYGKPPFSKLPVGTIATVERTLDVGDGMAVWITGNVSVPLFTSTIHEKFKTLVEVKDLEPLDDHWGPLAVPPKKATPSPQQGWARQLRTSRSVRARRP
jgi:hypothetical protein